MRKQTIALCVLTSLLAGCASSGRTNYVSDRGVGTLTPAGGGSGGALTTLGAINIQDFVATAKKFSNELERLAKEEKVLKPGDVVKVGQITNNTTDYLETDLLMHDISMDIGKIKFKGADEGISVIVEEDELAKKLAKQEQQREKERQDYLRMTGRDGDQPLDLSKKPVRRVPDYTLKGKITEDYTREGRTRQTGYIFQMTLTSVTTQLPVWSGREIIIKQGRKPAVGW